MKVEGCNNCTIIYINVGNNDGLLKTIIRLICKLIRNH